MLHHDRARAGSFGEDAERYDRARPGYPSALVDALLTAVPSEVLDVGCGTGIAGRLLSGRGCRVLGVDPDPRMAAIARRHGLAVEIGTFDDWDAAGRRFDLVTSAQAWHWVDPSVRAMKAATVLRPGGRIGLFWNKGVHSVDLKRRFDAVYDRHAPELKCSVVLGRGSTEPFSDTAASLRAAGFGDVQIASFGQDREYTTSAWLGQLPTHSDHRQLEPDRLRALLGGLGEEVDRVGGRFFMHYDTVLITASKPAVAGGG
jgi:SAM-dependent methyltransferase